jgi:hypothetical protein
MKVPEQVRSNSPQIRADGLPPVGRMWRCLGSLGIVYGIVYFFGFIVLSGNQPGIKAQPTTVINYFTAHHGAVTAGVFVVLSGAVIFPFFLSALLRTLDTSRDRRSGLSIVVIIAGAIYIAGMLLMVAVHLTLIHAAQDHQATVVSTLNYLDSEDFFPVIIGLATMALATGAIILKERSLPRWLGWASVGLGILALAGPLGGVAFLLTPIWTLAIGVVLARRASPAPFVEMIARGPDLAVSSPST